MKTLLRSKFTPTLLMLGCLSIHTPSFALDGRLTLRGLTGAGTYGDLDLLLPLSQGCRSLLYTDIQSKYSNDDDHWFVGGALGYRALQGNHIYGVNLFVDDAHSSHHQYGVISPGLETISCGWDLRLNGYIPFKRHHDEDHFFLSGDDCGNPGDCSFVEFKGHQQFEHRLAHFEEIATGADLIGGVNLPGLNCAQLHAGVYYYHFNEDQVVKTHDDHQDLVGVGARFDLPLSSNWSFTTEASYDRQEHASIALGLKFQVGHTPKIGCCPTLCDHLYDPVYRHIGPINEGAGVPIRHATKKEELVLQRDDIWFFSETGTATNTDTTGGTFENPFANNQLSQVTIDDIGTDTNLYFNTGTYVISGAGTPPNARITLQDGQSLFGRTTNFKCAANGDERPLLQGGIDINGTTGHRIASLQLFDDLSTNESATGLVAETTLLVRGGQVDICNSVIHAGVKTVGDNNQNISLFIIGINTFTSDITITKSLVEAVVNVAGDINGSISAFGLFLDNGSQASIFDSTFNVSAQVVDDTNDTNGTQLFGLALNHDSQALVFNSTINVSGQVAGDTSGFRQLFGLILSNGSHASVFDSNISVISQVGDDAFATAISKAYGFLASGMSEASIFNSTLDVLAEVGGNNSGDNLATGLTAVDTSLAVIIDSFVDVTAIASGGSNDAVGTDGNVTVINTPINETP